MTYELIAFDMDGTLLTSEQKIAESSVQAINKAIKKGKQVVFATGRSLSEIKEYRRLLPTIQYAILASGGLVYDLENGRVIEQKCISNKTIDHIIHLLKHKDIFVSVMVNGQGYLQMSQFQSLNHYHMEVYKDLYEKTAVFKEDMIDFIEHHKDEIEKINLYHLTPEARDHSFELLTDQEAFLIKAEYSGIEVTASKADKGNGLQTLAKHLNLPIIKTIAVGDADNDQTILQTAGLGIAMGNATENIKSLADVIVADHDHDGCREAIVNYLLKSN